MSLQCNILISHVDHIPMHGLKNQKTTWNSSKYKTPSNAEHHDGEQKQQRQILFLPSGYIN